MKKFLLLAAAMLGLVACNKDNDVNNDEPAAPGKKVVLHATVANPNDAASGPSRVAPTNLDQIGTSANINYTWEEGDVVYLVDNTTHTPHPFTVIAGTINGNTADFEGEDFEGLSTGAYMPFYCGDATISEVMNSRLNIAYHDATFKPIAYSIGTQSATAFTLDNFATVLHLKLKGDVTLGKIEYYNGSTADPVCTTLNISEGLTLSSTAQDVYIPQMSAGADCFTLCFYDNADNLVLTKVVNKNISYSSGYEGKIINFSELDLNLLPEVFTVSATKKVKFTKGNLYWDGTAFRLEALQTDYPTSWNANHVALFYWTTTAATSYAESYNPGSWTNTDVPFFAESQGGLTVSGTSGVFALSENEWSYLLNSRPNAASLKKYGVTVGGKSNCFVLAPDGFTGTLASSYTLAEANQLGLLCLPAPGYRDNSTAFTDLNVYGSYWSSTPRTDAGTPSSAFYIGFKDVVHQWNVGPRRCGQCLRLVCVAN